MIDTRLITLQDFWYHTARQAHQKRTISVEYHGMVDKYMQEMLQTLGQIKIPDFTTDILEDHFYAIRFEPVGKRQVKKALLNHTFSIAVEKRLIAENPVTKMTIIRTPYNPAYKLSDDAMQTLIAYNDGTILCELLKTQLFSGLALCELMALMAKDISLSSRTIHIQRFLKWNSSNKLSEICARIRHKKPRVIMLPEHALLHIQHALQLKGIDTDVTDTAKQTDTFIFSREDNTLFPFFKVKNYYLKVGRRTGIDHLVSRSLESNFGLRCASLSLNPKDLHLYLGYNTCYTVSKYYDYFDHEYVAPTSATERYYNRIMEEEA